MNDRMAGRCTLLLLFSLQLPAQAFSDRQRDGEGMEYILSQVAGEGAVRAVCTTSPAPG